MSVLNQNVSTYVHVYVRNVLSDMIHVNYDSLRIFSLSSRDDVRSSIDLLDRVIADFDDGLTSGAESDAAGGGRNNNHARGGNVSKRGGGGGGGVRLPQQQQRGPSPPTSKRQQIRQQNAAGNKAAAVAAAANGSKLSAKVDSIFSEVTHYGIEDQSATR